MKYFSLAVALLAAGLFSTETYAQWNINASPPYINYNGGNVGIGTTGAPAEKLHINGGNLVIEPASGNAVIYTGSGAMDYNRYLALANSPAQGWGLASGLKAGGVLVSDSYAFANPGRNDLIVKGKAGIGTAAPKTTLDLGNSGGAMFALNPGTSSGVNYTGFAHNDLIAGSWLTNGLSNAFISTGYIQDARRKFHIGSASSNTFATASFVPHFTVGAGGFVGIGAPDPRAKLDLGTSGGATMILNPGSTSTVNYAGLFHNDMIMGSWNNNGSANAFISLGYRDSPLRRFHIGTASSETFTNATFISHFTVTAGGNVGIGIIDPDERLTVKGVIHTNEVRVDMEAPIQGPDYVFEKDYDLLSLEALEAYINENKHLPEIPSAKEMEANGLNLKEMNLLLLKKVEELTLHVIELKKENEIQSKEIEKLKTR